MSLQRRIIVSLAVASALTLASLLYSGNPTITDDQSTPGRESCSYSVAGISHAVSCNTDVRALGWPLPIIVSSQDESTTTRSLSPFAAADFLLFFVLGFGCLLLLQSGQVSRLPSHLKHRLTLGLVLAITLTLASLFYRTPYHRPVFCIDECEQLDDPTNLNAVGVGWPLRILTLGNFSSINLATLNAQGLAADFSLALIVGFSAAFITIRKPNS